MKIFTFTLFIILFITGTSSTVWAHGGGHGAKPEKEETTLPELPDAGMDMKDTEPGGIDYGMSDPMDAFEMEEVGGGGPLWGEEPKPEPSEHEGHDMSQMKQVIPAEHEWVSTSQKGYGWAAALTLFSGGLFGFLTFRRPFE